MKYEEISFSNKKQVQTLLESHDNKVRSQTIVGMINGILDEKWVLDKLLVLIHDDDFWVAHNAINGLSDLARIHGTLNKTEAIDALLQVTNADLKGVISQTLRDFDIFLP